MISMNAVQRFGQFDSTIALLDSESLDFIRIYIMCETGIRELILNLNEGKVKNERK